MNNGHFGGRQPAANLILGPLGEDAVDLVVVLVTDNVDGDGSQSGFDGGEGAPVAVADLDSPVAGAQSDDRLQTPCSRIDSIRVLSALVASRMLRSSRSVTRLRLSRVTGLLAAGQVGCGSGTMLSAGDASLGLSLPGVGVGLAVVCDGGRCSW